MTPPCLRRARAHAQCHHAIAARDQNADAHRSGWLQGHISKQAARDPIKADQARRALLTAAERHLTFVDLFSGKGALRRDVPRAVPTRDTSVVWCADLLRPQSSIAGRLEDPSLHHRGAPYSPSTLEQRPFCLRGDGVVG